MVAKKPAHETKTHTRSPLKIYFLIMTLVGVIGSVISFGILCFSIGKQIIITNDEYIAGERYYEIENCKYNDYDGKESTKATTAEIKQCEEEKKVMLVQSRKVTYKQDVLGGAIRGILFFGIFIIHYPRFMRFTKKD